MSINQATLDNMDIDSLLNYAELHNHLPVRLQAKRALIVKLLEVEQEHDEITGVMQHHDLFDADDLKEHLENQDEQISDLEDYVEKLEFPK